MRIAAAVVAWIATLAILGSCETTPAPLPDDPFWSTIVDQPTLMWPTTSPGQDRVAVIRMNMRITDASADTMTKMLDEAEAGADYVLVEIDSPGGDAYASLRILSRLLKATKPIACIVPHMAASGAFVVLQGCKVRGVMVGSSLMMHKASFHDVALDILFSSDLEALDRLLGYFACRRLSLTQEDCRSMYVDQDWWMTEVEAVMYGAADFVVGSTQSVIEALQEPTP